MKNGKPMINNLVRTAVLAVATCFVATAFAQQTPNLPNMPKAPLELHAFSVNGEPFIQDKIRGKVTIVFFWATSCSVCRDSLPELRANLNGWQNKPFALVTVNVDKNASDWLSYERILGQTQSLPKGSIALRQDEGKMVPMKLPLTLLVDAKGKVVSRFEGRLAPEAWDGVAELIP